MLAFVVYYPFIEQKKTLIYIGDGWAQHYKALIYYSEYLKSIFKNLFYNNSLVIPQWSFSLGEGADIIETLSYYVIGDPIAFMSVLIPKNQIYIFYNFSIILRMFLSGISFIYLCLYTKINNKYAILTGSLAYAFCFWNIFNANRHIYFLNPTIYFPLIIIGVEKIFNNEKPYFFMLMVFICAISNFYFFYNIVLLTIIYVSVRLLVTNRFDFKKSLHILLIIIKYSILGCLMASVLLLPNIRVLLSDNRANANNGIHFIYPLSYYIQLISTFLSTHREYWMCMGFASPCLIAMFLSLIKPKNCKKLFILICISVLIILVPFFGQIFNGVSYISNKWSFAFALLIIYNLVFQWDKIDKERNKLIVLIVIAIVVSGIVNQLQVQIIISYALCFLFLMTSFLDNKMILNNVLKSLIVIINVIFIAYYEYTDIGNNYISLSTSISDDVMIEELSEAYTYNKYFADEKEFHRYSGSNLTQNASIISGTYSTDYYWSLPNRYTSDSRKKLELAEYSLYQFYEYDQRSTLYSLANVKYYITPKDCNNIIPSGFSYFKTFDSLDFYKNDNFLPFGYTYENNYSLENWQKLTALEKEEVMSEAVVLNKEGNYSYKSSKNELQYQISADANIQLEKNKATVNDHYSEMTIYSNNSDYQDIYLNISGVDYDDAKNWINGKNTRTTMEISCGGVNKTIEIHTKDSRYYNGRTDYVVYLGKHSLIDDSVIVTFKDKGIYSWKKMSLETIDEEKINKNLKELKEDVMQNVVFDINSVKGNILLNKTKYLVLSIPYSEGWSAFVDGEKIEVLNGNIGYCALQLSSGFHQIELKYNTPLLKTGIIISCLAFIIVLIDIILKNKNERKE